MVNSVNVFQLLIHLCICRINPTWCWYVILFIRNCIACVNIFFKMFLSAFKRRSFYPVLMFFVRFWLNSYDSIMEWVGNYSLFLFGRVCICVVCVCVCVYLSVSVCLSVSLSRPIAVLLCSQSPLERPSIKNRDSMSSWPEVEMEVRELELTRCHK